MDANVSEWGSAATDRALWSTFSKLMNSRVAPKRPMSAYMCFHQQRRARMVVDNPTLSFSDLGKLAAEEWRSLVAADRVRFEDLAKVAKAAYAIQRQSFTDASEEAAAMACRTVGETWTTTSTMLGTGGSGAGTGTTLLPAETGGQHAGPAAPTFVRLRERLEQLRRHHRASKKRSRSSSISDLLRSHDRNGNGHLRAHRTRPPTLSPNEATSFLQKRILDVKNVAHEIDCTPASLRLWLTGALKSARLCGEVQLKLEAYIWEWVHFEEWQTNSLKTKKEETSSSFSASQQPPDFPPASASASASALASASASASAAASASFSAAPAPPSAAAGLPQHRHLLLPGADRNLERRRVLYESLCASHFILDPMVGKAMSKPKQKKKRKVVAGPAAAKLPAPAAAPATAPTPTPAPAPNAAVGGVSSASNGAGAASSASDAASQASGAAAAAAAVITAGTAGAAEVPSLSAAAAVQAEGNAPHEQAPAVKSETAAVTIAPTAPAPASAAAAPARRMPAAAAAAATVAISVAKPTTVVEAVAAIKSMVPVVPSPSPTPTARSPTNHRFQLKRANAVQLSAETLRICQRFSKRRCWAKSFAHFATCADSMRSGMIKMLAHIQQLADAVRTAECGFQINAAERALGLLDAVTWALVKEEGGLQEVAGWLLQLASEFLLPLCITWQRFLRVCRDVHRESLEAPLWRASVLGGVPPVGGGPPTIAAATMLWRTAGLHFDAWTYRLRELNTTCALGAVMPAIKLTERLLPRTLYTTGLSLA